MKDTPIDKLEPVHHFISGGSRSAELTPLSEFSLPVRTPKKYSRERKRPASSRNPKDDPYTDIAKERNSPVRQLNSQLVDIGFLDETPDVKAQHLLNSFTGDRSLFDIVNISTLLGKLADHPLEDYSAEILIRVKKIVREVTGSVSNILSEEQADHVSARDVSTIARAIVKLDCASEDLMNQLADHFIKESEFASVGDQALMVWSLARGGFDRPDVFHVVAERISAQLEREANFRMEFGADEILSESIESHFLFTLVWSFGKVKADNPDFYHAMANELLRQIEEDGLGHFLGEGPFNGMQLATLAESFARGGYRDRDFFRRFGDVLTANLHHIPTRKLRFIAATYERVNMHVDALFEGIASQMRLAPEASSLGGWSKLLQSFAKLNYQDSELMQFGVDFMLSSEEVVGPDTASRFLWAAAIAKEEELVQLLWDSLIDCGGEISSDPHDVRRLFVVGHLFDLAMPPQLVEALPDMWKALGVEVPEMNRFEENVFLALESLGLEPIPQAYLACYHVDFAVEIDGKFWVIECDGDQYHRSGGKYHAGMRGDDKLKRDFFRKIGFSVLSIPASEWEHLKNPEEWLSTLLSPESVSSLSSTSK